MSSSLVLLLTMLVGVTPFPLRVLVLGDRPAAPLPAAIEAAVPHGVPLQLIDLRRDGETSEVGRTRFLDEGLVRRPDAIVIDYGRADQARTGPAEHRRVAPERYESNLRHFLTHARFHDVPIVFAAADGLETPYGLAHNSVAGEAGDVPSFGPRDPRPPVLSASSRVRIGLPWIDITGDARPTPDAPPLPADRQFVTADGRLHRLVGHGADPGPGHLEEIGPSGRVRSTRVLPVAITGATYATLAVEGRRLVAFQDTAPDSPTPGHVVVWVGTDGDLLRGEGAYRIHAIDIAPHLTVARIGLGPGPGPGSVVVEAQTNDARRRTSFRLAATDALVPTPGYRIPTLDLADETFRQTIVDREPGQYLGHPTTVLLGDGRTMITVYPKGHGRGPIVMKRSDDAGRTWSTRLPVPDNWSTSQEVPTIHRLVDPRDSTKRLVIFSGLYPARRAVSNDDGATWSPLEPVGEWGGIVVMGAVVPLKDGRALAMFHDDGRFFRGDGRAWPTFTLFQTLSGDGGLTWSAPEAVHRDHRVHLCEPAIIRSPDGTVLAALLRENRRRENSHVMFSRDEGATWSPPRPLPASLTGDRHTGRYAPDGRLVLSFRDTTRESPTQGDWVAWVGTFDDIVAGREGAYRVRLMDNQHRWDCAYPGVEVLADGTFVMTTYGHWTAGESPYIVSVRLTLQELDHRLASSP